MRLARVLLGGLAVVTGCGGAPGKAVAPDRPESEARYRLEFDGAPQAHFARARFLELANYLTASETAIGLRVVDLAIYNGPVPTDANQAVPAEGADAAHKKTYRRVVLEDGRVLGPLLGWAFEWEGGKSGARRTAVVVAPSGVRYDLTGVWPAGISGRELGRLRATAGAAPWRELPLERLELAVESIEKAR